MRRRILGVTTVAVVAAILALQLTAEQHTTVVNSGECQFIENAVRLAHIGGLPSYPMNVPERVYNILVCPTYTWRFEADASKAQEE